MEQYYNDNGFLLYHGDTVEILESLNRKVDMIFADPPYFCLKGLLCVQKGE